ncbi:MAG: methyltransferase domain-containing protein [Lachnospiraceae bacterium]|nr:methyltransferase domain-containing protein [Lachnospiraceae bacterium]
MINKIIGGINLETYIKGNKEAWEEAFDKRDPSWGANIVEKVKNEDYAFFNQQTMETLKKYDLAGKTIGQFCCNNGRELLSLVKTTKAKAGVGFDIAENMIDFANEKAKELELPCEFVAKNILEIDGSYENQFDVVLITIGALCWFKNLKDYFAIVSKCLKKDGIIIINEQHPFTNMLAQKSEKEYVKEYPLNCVFSYFSHEWISNDGMGYITGKNYESKTFTDYTHSMSEIVGSMCANHIVITNMQEFDYDISEGFEYLDHKGFPLSWILEGRKITD